MEMPGDSSCRPREPSIRWAHSPLGLRDRDAYDEAITPTMLGSNVVVGLPPVAERAAKGRHMYGEVILRDDPVAPARAQQIVLGDEFARSPQQEQQEFRCPGVEHHQFALLFQAAAESVKRERPKGETGGCLHDSELISRF